MENKSFFQFQNFKIFLFLAFVVLPLDQFLKYLTRVYLNETYYFEWFGFFVRLEWAENSGAFLSFGSSWSEGMRFWVFTVAVAGILIWAAWNLFFRTHLENYEIWGLQLLLVGGLGNLLDRIYKGTVTDYIQVGVGWIQTGIFNLVDMLIMAALFLMLLGPWLSRQPKKQD